MSAAAAPMPVQRSGRLELKLFFAVLAGGMAALLLLTVLVVVQRSKGRVTASCTGVVCPPPPGLPALITLKRYHNVDLRYEVGYDPKEWAVKGSDSRSLRLAQDGPSTNPELPPFTVDLTLTVKGYRSSEGSIDQLVRARLAELGRSVTGLAVDDHPEDRILGGHIGFIPGFGATYAGTTVNPNGVGGQEWVYVVASTDGKVTIVATVQTTVTRSDERKSELDRADGVLENISFPSQL